MTDTRVEAMISGLLDSADTADYSFRHDTDGEVFDGAVCQLRGAADLIASQAQEIAALRSALEFYADPQNWHGVYMAGNGPMFEDWADDYDDDQYPDGKPGSRARTALQQQENG